MEHLGIKLVSIYILIIAIIFLLNIVQSLSTTLNLSINFFVSIAFVLLGGYAAQRLLKLSKIGFYFSIIFLISTLMWFLINIQNTLDVINLLGNPFMIITLTEYALHIIALVYLIMKRNVMLKS